MYRYKCERMRFFTAEVNVAIGQFHVFTTSAGYCDAQVPRLKKGEFKICRIQ